jgi:hypothetical protein
MSQEEIDIIDHYASEDLEIPELCINVGEDSDSESSNIVRGGEDKLEELGKLLNEDIDGTKVLGNEEEVRVHRSNKSKVGTRGYDKHMNGT